MTDGVGAPIRHERRRLFALVGLFLAGLALTAAMLALTRSRIEQNERGFQSLQALRLTRAARATEDFFGDSEQLVNAIADTLGGVRGDRLLSRRLLLGLLRSRSNGAIYGMGVFYAPHVFDGRSVLFGPYDKAGPPIGEDLNDEHNYDYPKLQWYRDAANGAGAVVLEGPYREQGNTYISVTRAFYAGTQLAGVASVDIEERTFKRLLTSAIAGDDIAYVALSNGDVAISTTPIPPGPRSDISTPLRYSHSSLHLSTSTAALARLNGRAVAEAAAAIAATWVLVAMLGAALLRSWRARDAAVALQAEQTRLQHEIDVRKEVEVELRRAAYTDALTGLPNRTPFLDAISHAISATGNGSPPSGVFFIDLDRFNTINDTLGHLAGDEMLKIVGDRLRTLLDADALVGRLGGDEFIVLMPIDGGVETCARRLLEAFREPFFVNGHTLYTAASIGAAVVDDRYQRPEDVLRDADIAMLSAKQAGRGRFSLFDGSMGQRVARESELENSLRKAIKRREFAAYYQPVVALPSQRIASFEALIRWNRGNGAVEAGEFIGFAENRGLIGAIDALVRAQVCSDAPAVFERFPDASIAINLSADELTSSDIVDGIDEMLRSGLSPSQLKFEITETAVMTDAVHAQATVERLRDLGVEIVLDDFGQGHSSLAYLRRLPIAGVKIDRAFITPLGSEVAAHAIVRSIVALAETLELYTVAEGVETPAQLAAVNELGVTYAQGYYFAPAWSLATVLETAWVAAGRMPG